MTLPPLSALAPVIRGAERACRLAGEYDRADAYRELGDQHEAESDIGRDLALGRMVRDFSEYGPAWLG